MHHDEDDYQKREDNRQNAPLERESTHIFVLREIAR
jgi:hypothetical protein